LILLISLTATGKANSFLAYLSIICSSASSKAHQILILEGVERKPLVKDIINSILLLEQVLFHIFDFRLLTLREQYFIRCSEKFLPSWEKLKNSLFWLIDIDLKNIPDYN
jgi:hypothetical protein